MSTHIVANYLKNINAAAQATLETLEEGKVVTSLSSAEILAYTGNLRLRFALTDSQCRDSLFCLDFLPWAAKNHVLEVASMTSTEVEETEVEETEVEETEVEETEVEETEVEETEVENLEA